MNILQVSSNPQEIKCAPRSSTITHIVLIDEETGVETTINAPTINDYGYYIGIESTFTLVAGRFYVVQLWNLTVMLGYERVWCYKDGLQTDEHSSNNQFIFA